MRVMTTNAKHLTLMVHQIIDDGGEGVILRKPRSVFEHGRSPLLVKIKATRGDKEGIVVGVTKKQLNLKLPDGTLISVPTCNVETPRMPKLGEIVTFTFQSFSQRAIPVNPLVVRIRDDVVWEEVVANYIRESPRAHLLNEDSRNAMNTPVHRFGHWTAERGKNLRIFFEKFAKSFHMDPLIAETWYTIPLFKLREVKGGKSVITYCKGGVVPTLKRLFPDIGLDENRFSYKYLLKNWKDVKKRRKWFVNIAKNNHFDPLLKDGWYQLELPRTIIDKGQPILRHYSRSFIKALIHLFPEIDFDELKFNKGLYYQDVENRRKFFTSFASSHHFDPLLPSNWYSVPLSVISKQHGAWEIKSYYKNMATAVFFLFPNINLVRDKLFKPKLNKWHTEEARRQWFCDFAKERNFDPLIVHNWYPILTEEFYSKEGAAGVSTYHDKSFARALISLFPSLSFDILSFKKTPQNVLQDSTNRRQLFINFAKERKFDPLIAANWYKNYEFLTDYKGVASVAQYHRGVLNALVELFPEVSFELHLFPSLPNTHWRSVENRRKLLESIARNNNLDPLLPQSWYSLSPSSILSTKGIKPVLEHYKGSFAEALLSLFPDIIININLLPSFPGKRGRMEEREKRKIFENYAAEHHFDPLVKENWYRVDRSHFINYKGAAVMLSGYKGSILRALKALFPDLSFSMQEYRSHSKNKSLGIV